MKSLGELHTYVNSQNLEGKTDDEIFQLAARFIVPNFQMNAQNSEIYEQLRLYFNNNKKFKGNLKKGILLLGPYGTGKTAAMEIFSVYTLLKNSKKSFFIIDSDQVITTFTKQGRPGIENLIGYGDMCIDEIGQDSGKHFYYGSVDDPVEILIARRYNMYKAYGWLTHGVSNLDTQMLKQRFSGMIYDRMSEMFNLLSLTGESWRRQI